MKLSVIITTYNAEEWLHKVLVGYSVQTTDDFEIVIADDGSTPKVKEEINPIPPANPSIPSIILYALVRKDTPSVRLSSNWKLS